LFYFSFISDVRAALFGASNVVYVRGRACSRGVQPFFLRTTHRTRISAFAVFHKTVNKYQSVLLPAFEYRHGRSTFSSIYRFREWTTSVPTLYGEYAFPINNKLIKKSVSVTDSNIDLPNSFSAV